MQSSKLTIGILAHVDAGKTTLAEGILYTCGQIRTIGRVDHGDAFLDNFAQERERGITIFSKQALFSYGDREIILLDTPGHVDFSAEMERTLQVLDYAVLVISGTDGVQGHVMTLWRLLKRYGIPVFLFVNKMDREGTDRAKLMDELQRRLDEHCVDINGADAQDALAMCEEMLMEEYLEQGSICRESVAEAVAERKVFPCYFGSALKLEGICEFLEGINQYTLLPEYEEAFGARVFKISRDSAGNRLTHLKVTGGKLRVKMLIGNQSSGGEDVWEEKADQLRIYNGAQYQAAEEVAAGGICAVTGLTRTFAGQGLGAEEENELPILEPILTYRLVLPEDADPVRVMGQLRQLEEEEPQLHLVWKEESSEIHVQVMGEVQTEILKRWIGDRFGLEVSFGTGSIVYKETIASPVKGIGHFEPLRHYAEVHLLLEPGEPGSGLQFASVCSEDVLDRNWQRLILTHLEEKKHVGVLTGSEITDMRILLIAGRAHAKHTEGGDFRQATYRAVRQGLRKAGGVLLEPCFAFTLEIPTECLGRAMSDVQRMHGRFDVPVTEGDISILTGVAPVATMRDYQKEVNAYTRGCGKFSCVLNGYEPCHNAEEVVEQTGYRPEEDMNNPTGSVFCAHGAGFVVNWDEVDAYAHVESAPCPGEQEEPESPGLTVNESERARARRSSAAAGYITGEEIEAIFQSTFRKGTGDKSRYRRYHKEKREIDYGSAPSKPISRGLEEYFLVDGYNIIFAWPSLKELAAVNIDSARDKLLDILSNYQGFVGCTMIVVFDAYKVKGNPGNVIQYRNLYVVYTKEAETADQYIEKAVHKIGSGHRVTVATSDALEQMIIWGAGALRMSAPGLAEEIKRVEEIMRETYLQP